MKSPYFKIQLASIVFMLSGLPLHAQFKASPHPNVVFFEEKGTAHSMSGGWDFKSLNDSILIDYHDSKKAQVIIYNNRRMDSYHELELSSKIDNAVIAGDDIYFAVREPDSAYTVMYKVNITTTQKTSITLPANITTLTSEDYDLSNLVYDNSKGIIYITTGTYTSGVNKQVIAYNTATGKFSPAFALEAYTTHFASNGYLYYEINDVVYSCNVAAPDKKTKLFKTADKPFKRVSPANADTIIIQQSEKAYFIVKGALIKTPPGYTLKLSSNEYNVDTQTHKLHFMNNATRKMDAVEYYYSFNKVHPCTDNLYIMSVNTEKQIVTAPPEEEKKQKDTPINMAFVDKKIVEYMAERDKNFTNAIEYEKCIKESSKAAAPALPAK